MSNDLDVSPAQAAPAQATATVAPAPATPGKSTATGMFGIPMPWDKEKDKGPKMAPGTAPAPGSADRTTALWPGGPVTNAKGFQSVPFALYVSLIRQFEAAYGTGTHTVERLRRLNYSAYSHITRGEVYRKPMEKFAPDSVGGGFDKLIYTEDKTEIPAAAPPLSTYVLDELFGIGSVQMPNGEVVDLSHLYCQLDYNANGEGWQGTAISKLTGASIAGILSWTGDLASWYLEWRDPNKTGGIGEGVGGGDGAGEGGGIGGLPGLIGGGVFGGGDGKGGADLIHEPDKPHPLGNLQQKIDELNQVRDKKSSLDDMLGDMDAQVLGQTLMPVIKSGGSLADALDKYYRKERATGADRRFHEFVMRANPAIPYRVTKPGPQQEVALGPDARKAIYDALYDAYQALTIHPQPVLTQLDVLQYVADQFADFLVIGLATGKATWPPQAPPKGASGAKASSSAKAKPARAPGPLPGTPAPGAQSFADADGCLWIQLVEGSFECVQASYGKRDQLHVQVSAGSDPARFAALSSARQA